jgi:hypothetical protein
MRAHHFVVEYLRIAAGQFPGLEKRRPVEDFAQSGQRNVIEHRQPGFFRQRWRVLIPAAIEALTSRPLQRHQRLGIAAIGVALPHFGVIGSDLRDQGRTQFVAQQRRRDADRA